MAEETTKKKEKKAGNNIQRNAFQLTINNAKEYGYDHREIKKILVTNFTTLRFFCMADEIGAQGTPHTHIYVYFNSRVRFCTLKKHFEEAHIEIAHGTVQSNIDYIKKSGKWKDTEKSETSIPNTFEEWGTVPVQKGKSAELEELYQLVQDGYNNAEILSLNNDYIAYIDKIDKLRTMLLTEKFKDKRRLDLKVIYICGETGMGKTRDILDFHGDSNVYRTTDYNHPFDSYACQPVLVFEEFRSQLKLSDMLNYCDIYPIELPARYANKYACYNMVYIVSNWTLEQQYENVPHDSESWKAFLRRIHEIRFYHGDGSVTTYDSVEKYLKREEEFHAVTVTEQLNLPFKEGKEDGKNINTQQDQEVGL